MRQFVTLCDTLRHFAAPSTRPVVIVLWLQIAPTMAKGLIVGRATNLLRKWQFVARAWAMPRKHRLIFDSIRPEARTCLSCSSGLSHPAKLKSFLERDCSGEFASLSSEVIDMLCLCSRVIKALEQAIEKIRSAVRLVPSA